jgi:hypothetical protein
MTVAAAGEHEGIVRTVVREGALDTDEPQIEFQDRSGKINPDLTIGVDVTKCKALVANEALCSPGVKLHGDGFIVSRDKAVELGLGRRAGLERHIRAYRNGRDLTAHPRGVMVIDLFGVPVETVRKEFPEIYQHLLGTVKEQRASVFEKTGTRDAREYLDRWWEFGKPRTELRPALAGLPRYITTVETMRHRIFQFLDGSVLPDNKLIVLALDSAFALGVVSSRAHVVWATQSGGWLGVGNDSVYVKSRCFDPFPFPDATATAKSRIGALAEELDDTRKLVLAENPNLTLTTLYNVLAATREGRHLSPKEREVQARGRVLILKELHDLLDEQVLHAYGWPSDISNDGILERLVDLNQARVAEERRGFIKWLRPEYQIDKLGPIAHRADRIQSISIAGTPKAKRSFPEKRRDQAGCILDLLSRSRAPISADQLAAQFKEGERIKSHIQEVLTSLNGLGQIETFDEGRSFIRAAS